ncbi:hypothetical protein [Rhizobium sp. LjRoot254]|uniref:hypothetical protein n=1 Tax=Rhizobium sp. LjRoot254 TaxID=3342297 RepID=UPI003ECF5878
MLFNVEEAVERFEELMERARSGEEILISEGPGRTVRMEPIVKQPDQTGGEIPAHSDS